MSDQNQPVPSEDQNLSAPAAELPDVEPAKSAEVAAEQPSDVFTFGVAENQPLPETPQVVVAPYAPTYAPAYNPAAGAAYPGQGYAPPRPYVSSGDRGTNVMAILSLVFAFVFPLLGVIFGHIAVRQLQSDGKEGAGLAQAGLIVGYIFVALGALGFAFQLIALASLPFRS